MHLFSYCNASTTSIVIADMHIFGAGAEFRETVVFVVDLHYSSRPAPLSLGRLIAVFVA